MCRTYGALNSRWGVSHRFRAGLTYSAPTALVPNKSLAVVADRTPFIQAFGLAHEIEMSPRQVPVGNYSFRLPLRGLTLLKLIGEEVPNWNKYNPPQQTN
jgi:hypothetical protein